MEDRKCIIRVSHTAITMMNGSWSSPMGGGWNGPSITSKKSGETKDNIEDDNNKYYALIIDSGAIIKHSGFSTLHNSASKYLTTQGVLDEIRDSKARHHLESLPFQIDVREPSGEGIAKVIEFSKKTGDYASLSIVDLHVLALLYDLGMSMNRDWSKTICTAR